MQPLITILPALLSIAPMARSGRCPWPAQSRALRRQRGRQSADLAGRLRASADEVEAALIDVDRAPANTYVDVAKMRRAWADVQREATALTTHRAGTILLRGVVAGLYLNGR